VHAPRADLVDQLRDHPRRVAGAQDERAARLLVQLGEAVEQEAPARVPGRTPEPLVEHEDRQDRAVLAGRVERGQQRRMVAEPQIPPEPEHSGDHRPRVRTIGPVRPPCFIATKHGALPR